MKLEKNALQVCWDKKFSKTLFISSLVLLSFNLIIIFFFKWDKTINLTQQSIDFASTYIVSNDKKVIYQFIFLNTAFIMNFLFEVTIIPLNAVQIIKSSKEGINSRKNLFSENLHLVRLSVINSWLFCTLFIVIISIINHIYFSENMASYIIQPIWLITIVTLSPLLSMLSVTYGRIILVRSTNVFYNMVLKLLFSLPFVVFILLQLFNFVIVDWQFILKSIFILAVLNLAGSYCLIHTKR